METSSRIVLTDVGDSINIPAWKMESNPAISPSTQLLIKNARIDFYDNKITIEGDLVEWTYYMELNGGYIGGNVEIADYIREKYSLREDYLRTRKKHVSGFFFRKYKEVTMSTQAYFAKKRNNTL